MMRDVTSGRGHEGCEAAFQYSKENIIMSLPQPLPRVLAADEVVPTIQRIIAEREAVRDMVARIVTPETATF